MYAVTHRYVVTSLISDRSGAAVSLGQNLMKVHATYNGKCVAN